MHSETLKNVKYCFTVLHQLIRAARRSDAWWRKWENINSMQLEFRSFCVWRHVAGWLLTDVLKDLITFVFRVKRYSSWTAWPWNLRHGSTSKRRVPPTQRHGVTRRKTWIFN